MTSKIAYLDPHRVCDKSQGGSGERDLRVIAEDLAEQGRFRSKAPPVAKAIADAKGKIKDVATLKVAYDAIQAKCTDCHETYRLKLK